MAIQLNFDGQSLQELKKQLKELKNELAAATDPAAQEMLAQAVGQTADRMVDLNEQAKIFTAGSKFEVVSNSLGDIGGKLASLDFEGANESAGRLVALSKNIKFGDAVKGVKDLGSTFLQLGKALLTNPMFLLAAVIVAIVVAIVKLMEKIGLLKVIMDALGKVFGWIGDLLDGLIQALKDFTDWLGWTNNAAIDAAEQQAEAAEKVAVAQEQRTEAVTQSLEKEIKMAELQGKSTEDLERKKVYLIAFTAKKRMEADEAALRYAKLKGEADEEEIKNLEEKARKSKLAADGAKADTKIFEMEIAKEKRDARKKDQEEQDKADKAAADKAASDYKKRLAAQKEYNAQRLQTARLLEDLTTEAIADATAKELKQNEIKYQRLIEDVKRNEKLLADEKEKLTTLYAAMQKENDKKIQDAKTKADLETKKANDQKLLDAEKAYHNQFGKIGLSAVDAAKMERDNQYIEEKAALDKFLADKTITEVQHLEKLKQLNDQYNKDIAKIDADAAKEEAENLKKKNAEELKIITDSLDSLAKIFSDMAKNTGSALAGAFGSTLSGINALIKASNTEFTDDLKGKSEKIAAFTAAGAAIITGFLDAATESNKQHLDEDLANIDGKYKAEQELINSQLEAGVISKDEADKQLADLDKKAAAEKDRVAQEAFEQDKKLKIAGAIISGFQGAVSAFAGAMQLGPIAGPIVGGILAAGVAALTAVNIAKIKKTKYQSASSGAGGGGAAMGSASIAQAAPQFNLFGKGNDKNNLGPEGNNSDKPGQQMVVKAYVSETDLVSTTNRLSTIRESASL